MKKVFFLLAMFTYIFASCSDGGNEDPVTPPTQKPEVNNTPTITIDPTIQSSGLSFDVSASEKSITFSTTADWTLSIAETRSGTEWCTASPTSGGKGTATVKFKTTENTEPEDRSVAVTIKAGTASKTFTVTQKGNKSLLVTTKKYELPKEGGEIEIEVKANVEYEMTIAESAKEWITEATGRALTTHKHILAIAASEEAVKREGEITFKSGDIVETVKVYQAGEAVLLLSKNEFTVSEAGETISVDIKSNVDFGVQMPDVDWITEEDASRAMSSHTLKFVVAENETSEARSAEIVFYDKNSDLKNTLKVVQSAKEKKEGSYKDGVVTLVEAGTLKELLGSDYLNITSLKVVGPINGTDIRVFRQMLGAEEFNKSGRLSILDLEMAMIVEGGEWYYDLSYLDEGFLYTSNNVIGKRMFLECHNLQDIKLPKTITSIGERAFLQCWNLSSIAIPDGVNLIDDLAFNSCISLPSIAIPTSVTSIGNEAFSNCNSLEEVYISNLIAWYEIDFEGNGSNPCTAYNEEATGSKLYLNNELITELIIPKEITEIKQYAFDGCIAIKQVKIHEDITSIGIGAFKNCSSLNSINIPRNLTKLNDEIFKNCPSLISIELPNGITSIGGEAFYGCSSLASINIPNGVTSIGYYSFWGCSSLTSIDFPESVTSIGNNAFEGCSALTSIEIPDGITSIEAFTFKNCSSLLSITIPASVTSIDSEAINGLASLVECYCYATTPPAHVGWTSQMRFSKITVYVPKGCVESYKKSEFWKYFEIYKEIK